MMLNPHSGQLSANARDCLLHLSRTHISERQEIGQLNDQFVDYIEHVHYLEAESKALMHDINLMRSGTQADSTGINTVFETEITRLRGTAEGSLRSRQGFVSENNQLEDEVKRWSEKWISLRKSNLGIPKEVDDEFITLSNIEAENNLVLRRIKYLEDKHRTIRSSNNAIKDDINLMRMRKDQAVSLQQEYALRQTDLINSIRHMESENKRIIMNEHKLFTSDRSTDRHVFRDNLHRALAEIRDNYEARRIRNEQEIRIFSEAQIEKIQRDGQVDSKRSLVREEISRVKDKVTTLQREVSNAEVQNVNLQQRIDMLKFQSSEDHKMYELDLIAKDAEIAKCKEKCTNLTVELEKICDYNISLSSEIERYRRILDGSYVPTQRPTPAYIPPPSIRPPSVTGSHTGFSHQVTTTGTTSNIGQSNVGLYEPYIRPTIVSEQPLYRPPSSTYNIPPPGHSSHQSGEVAVVSNVPYPYHHVSNSASTEIGSASFGRQSPRLARDPIIEKQRDYYPDNLHQPTPLPPINPHIGLGTTITENRQTGSYVYDRPPSGYTTIHQGETITKNEQSFSRTSGDVGIYDVNRDGGRTETSVTHFQSQDVNSSFDEDHFQRFTRWYKGRVKISDVTTEYISLENRSAKNSANIGGFRIIHEFGEISVYVDLPAGLILGPKESLKIYSKNSAHEYGVVVADIPHFDTTTLSNTSMRNNENEVKSWFVYTSNSDVTEHLV